VSYFAQIIICHFEFEAADGGRPNPICMVARELLGARREWRVWEGEFGALRDATEATEWTDCAITTSRI
jgi:hypothetical protein